MGYWILVLFAPFIIPFVAKVVLHTTINWHEMLITLVVGLLLTTSVYSTGRYNAAGDVEILNGEVTGKEKDTVSCEHSYSCNCRESCSGSGSNRTCSTTCDTCYEHTFDYNWRVKTNVGDFLINRVDSQGAIMPPRWSRVTAGEPVARTHAYTNWIKAAPDSLFNLKEFNSKQYTIPNYPTVYDYHYSNRVIFNAKIPIDVAKEIDRELAHALKIMGPKKQSNVVVVFTTYDPNFAHALRTAWLGGKKNDTIVVVGVKEWPNIEWVNVFGWSKNEMNNVVMRDNILALNQIQPVTLVTTIKDTILKEFERRPMQEFEYLKDSIEPPTWVVIIAFILGVVVSGGLTYYFHRNDFRFSHS